MGLTFTFTFRFQTLARAERLLLVKVADVTELVLPVVEEGREEKERKIGIAYKNLSPIIRGVNSPWKKILHE